MHQLYHENHKSNYSWIEYFFSKLRPTHRKWRLWHLPFQSMLVLSALLFSNALQSQNTQAHFLNYSVKDGLPSNNIRAMLTDAEDFLWIATTNGLVRFDGHDFDVLETLDDSSRISDNNIRAMALHPDGLLWVGYYSAGVKLIDPKSGRVLLHMHENAGDLKLVENRITYLYQEGDSLLYIGVHHELLQVYNLKTGALTNFKAPVEAYIKLDQRLGVLTSMAQHPNNDSITWISTGGGLIKWNRQKETFLLKKYKGNLKKVSVHNKVKNIVFSGDSAMYIATWGAGIVYYNYVKELWDYFVYDPAPPLNGTKNIIIHINRKSSNEIWVSTLDSSLGVFNETTKTFSFYKHVPDDEFSATKKGSTYNLIGTSGGLWSSTRKGISHMSLERPLENGYSILKSTSQYSGVNYPITFFNDVNSGRLLLGMREDSIIYEYDLIAQTQRIKGLLPKRNWVRSILPIDSGYVLVTLSSGLQFLPYSSKYVKCFSENTLLNSSQLNQVSVGSSGLCAVATRNRGLLVFDMQSVPHDVKQFLPENIGLESVEQPLNFFSTYIDSRNYIWAGAQNGVFVYIPERDTFYTLNAKEDGYNAKLVEIYAFHEDSEGVLWGVTNNNGLFKLELANQTIKITKRISEGHGLPSSVIYSSVVDDEGVFYISTPKGISMVDPVSGTSFLLDRNNGLKNYDNLRKMGYTSDGYLNFAEPSKLRRISIARIKEMANRPVQNVKLSTINDLAGRDISLKDGHLVLDYDMSGFSFSMTTQFYNNPSAIEYYYKLSQNDSNWFAAEGNKGLVSNLKPGTYRLIAKALKPNGHFTNDQTLFTIDVAPPFWQTLWFKLLVLALVVGIFYVAYTVRIKQLNKESKLKEEFSKKMAELKMEALRSQMNPHFLFNSLNSINFYILNNQGDLASDYLAKFSALLRQVLVNSRQETVALNNEIDLLRIYCELESMRFNERFTYDINIDKSVVSKEWYIPPMVVQPYVENAIWHGLLNKTEGTRKLEIKVTMENRTLVFTVEDNGIGRRKSEELKSKSATTHKPFGMKITEERMKIMREQSGMDISQKVIDLSSEFGEAIGTRVVLKFKYLESFKSRSNG